MAATHRERHPSFVEGCFTCRVMTVGISASAMPNRSGPRAAVEVDQREARWDKDMPAYKRLRSSGLQPPRIDGCAELEAKATERVEVERGKLYGDRAKDAQEMQTVWRQVDATVRAEA